MYSRSKLVGALLAAAFAVPMLVTGTSAAPVDIVQVEGGKVKGVPTDVPGVQVFKGIPYAATTTGGNRFRAPQPVEPWEGVKTADTWPNQSMQKPDLFEKGSFWYDEFYYDPEFNPDVSEDGLYLNLFTPARDTDGNLPVYVWIHGGGNDHGYGSEMEFWATKLAEKGIIVVSVQYRLGIFGFLAMDELGQEDPMGANGNWAMLDLIKALEWVQDNIAGFGGDPTRVTVGGQSAGAGNTVGLLKSPLAAELFDRAIVQSNSSGLFHAPYWPLEQRLETVSASLHKVFDRPMTLADLRAIPAQDFATATAPGSDENLYTALIGGGIARPSKTIDGVVFTDESVNLFTRNSLNGKDILIGSVSDERTSTAGDPAGTMTGKEFAKEMQAKGYSEDWKNVYKYSDPTDAYRTALRAEADLRFQNQLVSAEVAKKYNPASNIYVYYFNHFPPGRNSEFYRAYHSSDLWYFLNSIREGRGNRPWTEADYRMADTISTYVANFVKTGDPNGSDLPDWPQVDGGDFMRFHQGYAYPSRETPYPARDTLNRAAVLAAEGLTEADLGR
ncbi:carboxylesterase/lipase family protein [Chelativorans salis]|uniref:Carboxylic ester hydrolase n=1 Tax=Chelativorans salis TaxID=2978478 RepID=A0ABT2LQA7_9HYPH|nr:carboxylesterase family protein [Chelativorans sp. EGI FJ00035]MCT7376730.1 carboxylesterase family protein [Chelativorans sp. EGI FJ00035]